MANKSTYYITVSSGMSGYYAVKIIVYPDGFQDIQDTGVGRYPTVEEAIEEAKEWAEEEYMQFKEP